MADPVLINIGYIVVLLIAGLIGSIISRKLKIPNLIILIGIGMGIGHLKYKGQPIIQLSPAFLAGLAIITLALVVFDSSSKFRFRKFDTIYASALKLFIIFLLINLVFLSAAAYYIFKPVSIILAIIFAAVVSGTDLSSTLIILSGARSKLFELLKAEAILNTPLTMLIPFLLADILKKTTGEPSFEFLLKQLLPFAQLFVVGIGTGIFVGLIFFRFMKKYYNKILSPLSLVVVALLAYVGAEMLGGSGVLSVAAAGLLFGNLYHIRHIKTILKFGKFFSEVFEIIIFVLVGTIIKIPWTKEFLLPASMLFVIYLFFRFLSVEISFMKSNYKLKEKLYMTLNISKGIAVAVVVFALATKAITGIKPILDLILLFLIYSIILSMITTHFSKFFTKVNIKMSEEQ